MGILEILTVVFVVAKLAGYLDWSWWIVLSPLSLALTFYVVMFLLLIGLHVRVDSHDKA